VTFKNGANLMRMLGIVAALVTMLAALGGVILYAALSGALL
jgi:hypothetical protein